MAATRSSTRPWAVPLRVSEPGQDAYRPQIALDGDGEARSVWTRMQSDIQGTVSEVHTSSFTGGRWGTPDILSDTTHPAVDPQVAIDRLGNALVVWLRPADGHWVVQAATQRSGDYWHFHAPLSTSDRDAYSPRTVVDGQGNFVAAWHSTDGSRAEIQVAALDEAGPFSSVERPRVRTHLSADLRVRWSAVDAWSSIDSYDVRFRVADAQSGFSTWGTWLDDVSATSAMFRTHPGHTYCFAARARDLLSQTGPWSHQRCTAAPLDDRALVRRGRWFRARGENHYHGTITTTRRQGATLSMAGVRARHVALVVSRAPGAGRVQVLMAGENLGTYSLASRTVQHEQVIDVKDFGRVRYGTVRIRVVSRTGRAVRIDGLLASRVDHHSEDDF